MRQIGKCIFDSALSHTRRSDALEKKEENSVSTFGRFRLWTSFESSPVSVKKYNLYHIKKYSLLKTIILNIVFCTLL